MKHRSQQVYMIKVNNTWMERIIDFSKCKILLEDRKKLESWEENRYSYAYFKGNSSREDIQRHY